MNTLQQYWLLCKRVVKPALFGRRGGSEGKGRRTRQMILLLLSELSMALFLTYGYLSMAKVLGPEGQLSFVPMSALAAGTGACLLATIFMADGTLFDFKGCEVLMALPLRSSVIAAARLTIVYANNLYILLPVMGPAAIACGIYAQPDWGFYLSFAIGMLLTPLLPMTAGTLLGILAATAASRFRNRSAAELASILVVLGGVLLLFNNWEEILGQLQKMGPQLSSELAAGYPPAAWFAWACLSGNAAPLALLAGVSLAAYSIYCWAVGRAFRRTNSVLTSWTAQGCHKPTAVKMSGKYAALLRREWKRLSGSPGTFVDIASGPLTAVILAALMYLGLAGSMDDILELQPDASGMLDAHSVYVFGACFLAVFIGAARYSVNAIALEGHTIWIAKTAPVSTQIILQTKLLLSLMLCAVAAAGAGIFVILKLPYHPLYSPFLILTPFVFGVLTTMWGLKLSLLHTQPGFLNEQQSLRHNRSAMLLAAVNSGLGIGCVIVCALTGSWFIFVTDAALLIWSAFHYRWLMTKGVEIFEAYEV